MILTDEEAKARLNNPLNLVNRLVNTRSVSKANGAMSIFGLNRATPANKPADSFSRPETPPETQNQLQSRLDSLTSSQTGSEQQQESKPEESEKLDHEENINLDNLISNADVQVKLSQAHNGALEVLNIALNQLKLEVPDMKADKIPSVITATTKVIETIRKEKIEAIRNNRDVNVKFHFYTPEQRKLTDYEVIEVESKIIDENVA